MRRARGAGATLGGAQQVVELERGWIGAEPAQRSATGVQADTAPRTQCAEKLIGRVGKGLLVFGAVFSPTGLRRSK
jgi:hypothetical protein